MTWLSFPWAEACVAVPFAAALVVAFLRDRDVAARVALVGGITTLAVSFLPWAAWAGGGTGSTLFAVDGLTAPLLPLAALLHVLTVLMTARVKRNRMSLTGHLVGEGLLLGAFAAAPTSPWVVVAFLAAGTLPPLIELCQRGRRCGIYVGSAVATIAALVAGQWAVEAGEATAGAALLAVGVLLRGGVFPLHLWVADLFDGATFGTALLHVAPLPAALAFVRLVLPVASADLLDVVRIVALTTAVYTAGLATVQRDGRRFIALLLVGQSSLVLVGLASPSFLSLTGALCLWVSTTLSLGGLGLALRAVEARIGRLPLHARRGLYERSPLLAVAFLATGLAVIGFPGTIGFIAAELLVDGAIESTPLTAVGMVVAVALGSIAVVRTYLLLFTGDRHESPLPMDVTPRERLALVAIMVLIVAGGVAPQVGLRSREAAAQDAAVSSSDRHAQPVDH